MAYQVGATCYATAPAAVAAIASNHVGSLMQHGGAVYVVDVVSTDATSIQYVMRQFATTNNAMLMTAPVTLQPCGLLDWQDGLALGWGIAAAWIATAVVLHLRKAVHE